MLSSPYIRARQTAQAICAGAGIKVRREDGSIPMKTRAWAVKALAA